MNTCHRSLQAFSQLKKYWGCGQSVLAEISSAECLPGSRHPLLEVGNGWVARIWETATHYFDQPGSSWNVFFNWKAWNLGVSGCVGEQESLPVRGFHWSTTFMPSCFRHRHTHTCCMCSVRPFVLQLLVPVWSCRYLRGYLHSFVLMDAAARLGSFFLVCLNSTSPRCSLLRGHTSSVCCLLVNWDLRREAWLDRMDK